MPELYTQLVEIKAEIDNHYSDLYVKVNPEVTKLVKASGYYHQTFKSNIDGKLWYDVAFQYTPFWERVARIEALG